MTNLKRKVEELEERVWQNIDAKLDRYLSGRSVGDVEFFCRCGYLPETPIGGPLYHPTQSTWKERWSAWKRQKRAFAGRTEEEIEFYCVNGRFQKGGGEDHSNP